MEACYEIGCDKSIKKKDNNDKEILNNKWSQFRIIKVYLWINYIRALVGH